MATHMTFPNRPPNAMASLLRWTGAAIAIGAILAIFGPFGTYGNGGPVARLGYWIAAMLLGLMLYGAAYRMTIAVVPATSRWTWPAVAGAALLASVPEALATRAGAFWLWPDLARHAPPVLLWSAQTMMIGLMMTLGSAFVLRRLAPPSRGDSAAALPHRVDAPAIGGDVLALQMEDHYVRVHRQNGSELILMPLGRAIDAMTADGLQTHRSWWVARHAVASIEGTPRALRVHLTNDVVAPVARSAVARLKAAGWIAVSAGRGSTGDPRDYPAPFFLQRR